MINVVLAIRAIPEDIDVVTLCDRVTKRANLIGHFPLPDCGYNPVGLAYALRSPTHETVSATIQSQ